MILLAEAVRLANGIGIVRLYGFSGSSDETKLYAEAGRAKIRTLSAQGVCRFIIDLRPDVGGNMYPMIEAVGGLLDDGVLGTFENAAGKLNPWVLKDGKVTMGATVDSRPSAISMKRSLPVAMLI